MRNWQNNGLMFPLGLYPLLLNRRHFAIFTVLKRSLGQGNVFRPVCLFTGGGGLPTGGLHPVGSAQEGLHLGCATGGSAWGDVHPGVCIQGWGRSASRGGWSDSPLELGKWTVHILLECFLVFFCLYLLQPQKWIQDFPDGEGGTNPKRGGTELYVGHFPPKTAWNWKKNWHVFSARLGSADAGYLTGILSNLNYAHIVPEGNSLNKREVWKSCGKLSEWWVRGSRLWELIRRLITRAWNS